MQTRKIHLEDDLSFQSFSDAIYREDRSLSNQTSAFPTLSIQLEITCSQSSFGRYSRGSVEGSQPAHDLSFREDNLSEEEQYRYNDQSFEQSEMSIQEEQQQQQNYEESVVWMEEHEAPDPSWISPELTEQSFFIQDHSQMSSEEESRVDSPFFPEPQSQEGLSVQDIRSLPTMQWGVMHQKFNGGQKCSVCLEEYQLGHTLRVMTCLHRFHIDCLDEWLQSKASCPNCRMQVN